MKLSIGFIKIVALVLIVSCGVRMNSGGNKNKKMGEKYITSYFKGDNVFLYFVKPFTLHSDHSELKVDFTFLVRNDTILDSVTMNYSIISANKLSNHSILGVYLDSTKVEAGKLLFAEKLGKEFKSRFSAKISPQVFLKLKKSTILRLKTDILTSIYQPSSRFSKKSLASISDLGFKVHLH